MRTLKPICLTAAVALALAGGSALAQTSARVSTAGTTTATSTGTASTTGTATNSGTSTGMTRSTVGGGCAGTNGSTCSASDTNTNGSTAGGLTTVQSPPTVSATTSGVGSSTVSGPDVGRVQGANPTTVDSGTNRTGAFDAGGAFGPQAVPATTGTNGTNGTIGTGTLENGIVLPAAGSTNPSSQQNVFVQPSQSQSGGSTLTSTPTFDQAAREGRAREARRRSQGQEPRVIGIAPRTERDLTWQMPDDPIIRY